jgi:broad specificity phosphatase PhoE
VRRFILLIFRFEDSMTELILLRHGKTALNEKGVYCGSSDPSLSAQGIAETKRTARLIKAFAPDAAYASSSRRAVQTARIVSPHMPAIERQTLREMDFGDFEGLNADDIACRMPEMWQNYLSDPLAFAFPDGDSVPRYLQGAYEAVRQIIAQHDGQRVLIVTHKGVIMAALSSLLHGDFKHGFCYDIRPSGLVKLRIFENSSVLSQLY